MKKLLILFALLYVGVINAQDSHMAINMGLAMPLGDFSETGKFLENGYTDPGFNLTIDGIYVPSWYFGIGGNISFSTFGLDDEQIESDLIDKIKDVPEIPGLDTVTKFEIGTWSYANFLVGPVLALPAGKFQFDFKALVGLSILMPTETAMQFTFEGEEYITYNEPQNGSFGMLFGADILYKPSSTYSIKIGANYFRSRSKGERTFEYQDSELVTLESDIPVEALHLTLGIAYLF